VRADFLGQLGLEAAPPENVAQPKTRIRATGRSWQQAVLPAGNAATPGGAM